MAIAFVATSTGPNSNATTTTISLPTGFNSAGNITIVSAIQGVNSYAHQGGGTTPPTITPPSGWTALTTQAGSCVCYRLWQSGDPSSVTVTSSATAFWESVAVTYSGVDATTPIDTSSFCVISEAGASTPASFSRAPSLNPGYANDQLVCVFMSGNIAGSTLPNPTGLTSRGNTSAGPAIRVSDKVLSSAAVTADFSSSDGATIYQHVGMQVALKTSGDTPVAQADAIPVFAGLWTTANSINTTSMALDFTNFYPKTNDLIAVFISADQAISGAPSGYSLGKSVSNTAVYTHAFTNGDSTNITFTWGSSTTAAVVVAVIRPSMGTVAPVFDQATTATGTTTVTTVTQTPVGASELLVCFFGDTGGTGGTFGSAAGLTNDFTSANAHGSYLFSWVAPAASPTGTFSSTESPSGHSVSAIAALFQIAASSTANSNFFFAA